MSIPFVVPAQFQAAVNSGAVQQIGALLKDSATGKIVAHMQESGAMQTIASELFGLNPVTSIGSFGIDAANTALAIRADRKLNAITDMLGNVQTLQILNAASSIAGIGVTVASTMVILNRLKGITEGLKEVTDKIDVLPQAWHELEMQTTLGDVETQLERLEEIETRKAATAVLEDVEGKLHTAFNRLHRGTMTLVVEVQIDPDLLRQLIAGLSLAGGAQIRALYELDEIGTAAQRAKKQFDRLANISMALPNDILANKLRSASADEEAAQLSKTLSQLRLNMASQPSLAKYLLAHEISGPDYLARAREEEEPLLLLPVT